MIGPFPCFKPVTRLASAAPCGTGSSSPLYHNSIQYLAFLLDILLPFFFAKSLRLLPKSERLNSSTGNCRATYAARSSTLAKNSKKIEATLL